MVRIRIRINFNFYQQVYGPLLFSLNTSLTLQAESFDDSENNLIFRGEHIR